MFGHKAEQCFPEEKSMGNDIPMENEELTPPDRGEVDLMFGDLKDWELHMDFSNWGQAQMNDPDLKEKYNMHVTSPIIPI